MSDHYVKHYGGYTVVFDEEDGAWGAYVEDLPVCFTVADTREDCEMQIQEAIAVYLDALRKDRQERPELYAGQAAPTGQTG